MQQPYPNQIITLYHISFLLSLATSVGHIELFQAKKLLKWKVNVLSKSLTIHTPRSSLWWHPTSFCMPFYFTFGARIHQFPFSLCSKRVSVDLHRTVPNHHVSFIMKDMTRKCTHDRFQTVTDQQTIQHTLRLNADNYHMDSSEDWSVE